MQHTNLLVGSLEWALSVIPVEHQETSPDVSLLIYDRMYIEEVRTLIQESSMRPVTREYRVFIIVTQSILAPAQNALLKLFEEPNTHTIFYFVIPRMDILLPTLKSRFHIFGIEERRTLSNETINFFSASYAERLSLIAQKIEAEDFEWVMSVVEDIACMAHSLKNPELIRDVLFLESYIHTVGSSKKMLLEHIALTLPEKMG